MNQRLSHLYLITNMLRMAEMTFTHSSLSRRTLFFSKTFFCESAQAVHSGRALNSRLESRGFEPYQMLGQSDTRSMIAYAWLTSLMLRIIDKTNCVFESKNTSFSGIHNNANLYLH